MKFPMQKKIYEFISKKTNDPIIERKTCRRTGNEFPIFQSEKDLLEKISPTIAGKKYNIDLPQLCPEARQIKRLAFRNERSFYKFQNDEGKYEISTIAPEMNRKIMKYGDFLQEDMTKYGMDYSGNIDNDLKELFKNTPFPSKLIFNMENAEFCNQETDDKNCYLNAGGHFNENSMYNTYSLRGKRTVDNYWTWDSEQIYNSIYTFKSQKVFFSNNIENSYNIHFGENIKGSQNVLFGYGLRNSNYIYKNKILSKEEREKIYSQYTQKLKSYSGLLQIQKEYNEFISKFPKKATIKSNTENCIGNYLTNSKNLIMCNAGEESQDSMYSNIFAGLTDCIDIESIGRGSKLYNSGSSVNIGNSIVISHILENSSDIMYSYMSQNSKFLTASIGFNNKEYCILNKQYTQQEREKITINIIEELQSKGKFGEFFDLELSPFPYNDSVANEYYPINENQLTILEPERFISDAILDLGGEEKIKIKRRTKNQDVNIPQGIDTIHGKDIPDNIDNITDDILKKAIICSKSGRLFRYVNMELDFHRKHNLPLPRVHPDIRHQEKISKSTGRDLHLRTCDKTREQILSVYPPDSPFKVYSAKAYENEIY